MIKNIIKAFTLSEVLVTLAVIGVIAAITFPIINSNTNDKALKVALKKNYSLLSQAVKRYYADNGQYLDGTSDTYSDFLLRYFTVLKKSFTTEEMNEMKYSNYIGVEQQTYFYFKGHKTIMLTDGTLMYPYDTGGTYETKGLLIDVNGPYKKPNTLGKDTFFFYLHYKENTPKAIIHYGDVIPGGSDRTNYNKTCNETDTSFLNGFGCTIKVLNEK